MILYETHLPDSSWTSREWRWSALSCRRTFRSTRRHVLVPTIGKSKKDNSTTTLLDLFLPKKKKRKDQWTWVQRTNMIFPLNFFRECLSFCLKSDAYQHNSRRNWWVTFFLINIKQSHKEIFFYQFANVRDKSSKHISGNPSSKSCIRERRFVTFWRFV